MGACVSTPEGCARCRLSSSEKIKLRRKGKENTTVKRRSVPPCRDDRSDGHAPAAPPLRLPSSTNPTFEGPPSSMPTTTSLLFHIFFFLVSFTSISLFILFLAKLFWRVLSLVIWWFVRRLLHFGFGNCIFLSEFGLLLINDVGGAWLISLHEM
jgi:hypothetical protein